MKWHNQSTPKKQKATPAATQHTSTIQKHHTENRCHSAPTVCQLCTMCPPTAGSTNTLPIDVHNRVCLGFVVLQGSGHGVQVSYATWYVRGRPLHAADEQAIRQCCAQPQEQADKRGAPTNKSPHHPLAPTCSQRKKAQHPTLS